MRPAPSVDALVSTYNEEAYVERCLRSVLGQRYAGSLSVWLIDGGSTDRTVAIARALAAEEPRLTVIAGRGRLNLPEALNVGIERSRGELVAKIDAHGQVEPDFIDRAVRTMQAHGPRTGCVGGRPLQIGHTPFGRALALARTSRLGVGASGYASSSGLSEVDTVQCGLYRRRALEEVGGFDPAMEYGEDEELNWRLRRAGWKIVLDPRIRFQYITRPTWRAAFRQYRNYGAARVRVVRKHPGFLRIHHLVPPAFVAGMIVQAAAARFSRRARRWLALTTSAYTLVITAAALRAARAAPALAPRLAMAFAALHLGYGWGVLRALVRLASQRR